jgi:hypothetical protein
VLARAILVVVVALAAINLAALAAVRGRRLDERPVDVQTRDLLRARAATLDPVGRVPQVAFAGDSLVFGQHLAAEYGARWPEHALAAQYARLSRRSGRAVHAVNLGVNGVLFRELECVAAEALARRPALLFINVSPRPFGSDFATGGPEANSARPLCPAAAGPLDRAVSPLRDELFDRLPILRYRDLAHFAYLDAPARLAAASATRRLLGLAGREDAGDAARDAARDPGTPGAGGWDDDASAEDAAVLREMAWRLRAARRYDSIEVSPGHPQAAFLRSLLRRLESAAATRTVVFYLEEDMTRLAEQVDVAHFERQRDAFIAMLRGLARGRVTFRAVRREEMGDHYRDQVHLDGDGYLRLAGLLRAAAAGPPP